MDYQSRTRLSTCLSALIEARFTKEKRTQILPHTQLTENRFLLAVVCVLLINLAALRAALRRQVARAGGTCGRGVLILITLTAIKRKVFQGAK